jgi:hypothetical protein
MQWRDLLQEPGQPALLPLLPTTDDLSEALTEALYDLIISDLTLYLACRQAIEGCQSLGGAAFQLERLLVEEPPERREAAQKCPARMRAAVLHIGWRLVRWYELADVIGGDLLPAPGPEEETP